MPQSLSSGERRTITIFFVIDSSDDLVGGGMEAINSAITRTREKLNRISEHFMGTVAFRIEILRFSNFCQACNDLLPRVNSVEDSAILVVLASKTEVDCTSALNQLTANENFQKSFKWAIPIGIEAENDGYLLRQFVGNIGKVHDGIQGVGLLCREIHERFITEMLIKFGIDAHESLLRQIIVGDR